MKHFLMALSLASLAALFAGCSSMPDDPAVMVEYSDELGVLRQSDELTDKEKKYEAAKTVFSNVDFTQIKDVDLLRRLLGRPSSTSRSGTTETIEYKYESLAKGKTIRASFQREGNAIVKAEVVRP